MNRDEGTPVDNEVVLADEVGTELTVPRREQAQVNTQARISTFERDMAAAGKITAEDRELIAIMKRSDINHDGEVSLPEALTGLRDAAKSRLELKKTRRMLFALFLFTLFLLLGIGGLVALVTAIYKDTYVKGDTTMSNAEGEVVGTRVATHNLPLIVAPVLPDDELFSVETLRVTLPGSRTTGLAEVGSGEVGSDEAISEIGPGEVNSFRISRVQKINSTAVVFHALGGETIRVWNGVTTVRLSPTGPEIPVCSADVTCAAFQVEGAELAEKYLAKAEALLVPFEEGRRRLAEACLDPYSSDERDAAQAAAQGRCNPVITTAAACKTFAAETGGLTWGGSHSYHRTKGCFAYQSGKTRYAFFGTGGSLAQMAGPSPDPWPYHRFSEKELSNYVNRNIPHCLLLSNQAKLEAKLDPAFSYYTSTQECLVAKDGVSTCTDLYQIPANYKNGKAVTGTLKVGAAVTSIGTNAFRNTQITGIDLSEATALKTISDWAFSYNTQLTGTLKMGPAVTSIGFRAFYTTGFTGLDLSEATALQTIAEKAFYNIPQLTGTLKVGPAVTSIGKIAFYGTKITGIDLSEATALQTIGDYAFYGTRVTELDISKATALKTIGHRAFDATPIHGQEKCKSDGTPRCFTL